MNQESPKYMDWLELNMRAVITFGVFVMILLLLFIFFVK